MQPGQTKAFVKEFAVAGAEHDCWEGFLTARAVFLKWGQSLLATGRKMFNFYNLLNCLTIPNQDRHEDKRGFPMNQAM